MDEGLLRAVNALSASPLWSTLGLFFSSAWVPVLIWTPLLGLLLYRRRFALIASIALSIGASDLVNARVLKPLVARERPCRALDGLERPVRCNVGKSFASGHAAVSFAFLLSAAPAVRLGWALFTPLALMVSGSRVLLGVHYPSDVLGGALLGALFGAGGSALRRRFERAQSSQASSS